MGRYFVQSGQFQMVVQADTHQGAALWAVHQALTNTLPFLGDSTNGMNSPGTSNQRESCRADSNRLESWIDVSQVGSPDGEDHRYDTLEVVTEWNQLIVALTRIENQYLSRHDETKRTADAGPGHAKRRTQLPHPRSLVASNRLSSYLPDPSPWVSNFRRSPKRNPESEAN